MFIRSRTSGQTVEDPTSADQDALVAGADDQDHWEHVLEDWDAFLADEPENAMAWGSKAWTLARLGRRAEAFAAYQHALELDRDNASIWNNFGSLLTGMARYDESLAAFEQAQRLAPNDPYIWSNLGRVNEDRGRSAEALAAYDHACRLDASNAHLRVSRAKVLGKLKQYPQALA